MTHHRPWLGGHLQSIATVDALGRTGTGFMVGTAGHFLTATHCVVDDSGAPAGQITVAFHGGGTMHAVLVGVDVHAGVAVLRLPPDSVPLPLPVRRHTYPAPGDTCVVLGNISGQDPRSVAVGTVRSGTRSTVWTDVVVSGAGTSGAPILDAAGHVVALHTAGRTAGYAGGIAAPLLWHTYRMLVAHGTASALPCTSGPWTPGTVWRTRATLGGTRCVVRPGGGLVADDTGVPSTGCDPVVLPDACDTALVRRTDEPTSTRQAAGVLSTDSAGPGSGRRWVCVTESLWRFPRNMPAR